MATFLRRSTLPLIVLLALPCSKTHAKHDADAPELDASPLTVAMLAEPTTGPHPSRAPITRLPDNPWFGPDGLSRNARQLLTQIEGVTTHGLDPARYRLDGLRRSASALPGALSGTLSHELSRTTVLAEVKRRFELAFTRLATDLGRGVVDARTLQSRLYRDRPAPDIDALRAAIGRGEMDVDRALQRVAVAHPHYERMRSRMRDLLAERDSGLPRIRMPVLERSLSPGQRHDSLLNVKARLIQTGDLERQSALTPWFDEALAAAIQRFQRRHGIEPVARLDAPTRTALARGIEEEMDELALNLERWRWMPRELGQRHVFINLPDYTLQLVDGDETLVDMPVVIGETRYPTPSFSRDMSYIEFNPTWTVPASIANRSLVPNERRRPGYLQSRRFDVLERRDGRLERVPHERLSAADFETRPFPYTLRQRSGPANALGRMKFMMPNRYAIYLHDTPMKEHFTHHDRAYSNGCIRLSDPEHLARVLLSIDGHDDAKVERTLGGTRTTRLSLRTPVPTHFAYFTAWVDDDGALQRRDDVYEHDPALRDALRERGALPSTWLGPTLWIGHRSDTPLVTSG